jgi:GDPmannose 4,6-dehydratase
MKAIVTGITGQDGYYMAQLLLQKGIKVIGLARYPESSMQQFTFSQFDGLEIEKFDYSEKNAFSEILKKHQPELVFNFAAKSTGLGMFDSPSEMIRLNGTFVLDILEALRNNPKLEHTSFCQASSSEMFGNVSELQQDESTSFNPKSPYGAAKLFAHNMVGIYRKTYGIRCCSAILYNHESVRRSTQFVTRKIANGAARISLGLQDFLYLDGLGTSRDWGYAPEYVNAMYLMAINANPSDYVVATGKLNTVRDLCEIVFKYLGLNYLDHVRVDEKNLRINPSIGLHGNPSRIWNDLGWRANYTIDQIMKELVDNELSILSREA